MKNHNKAGNWLAVFIIGIISVAIIIELAPRRPIADPDAFDYLQIGMRIAAGEGLSSGRVMPEYLAWFHEHKYETVGRENVALLERYLLPVLIEGTLLRFGLEPYRVAQLYSAMGYVLSNILLVVLFGRMVKQAMVAFLLVLGFMLAENAIGGAVSGLTEPLALAIFTANLLVLLSHVPKRVLVVLLGILTVVAYLNRSASIFYTIPLNLVGLWSVTAEMRLRERYLALGAFFLTALIFILPVAARNMAVAGTPFFSFADRFNLLFDTNLASPPSERDYYTQSISSFLPAIGAKFLKNVTNGLQIWRKLLLVNVLILVPFLLGVFFLVGAKFGRKVAALNRFVQNVESKAGLDWKKLSTVFSWLGIGLVGNFLGVALFTQFERFYTVFHPFVLLMAWCGLCVLATTLPLARFAKIPLQLQISFAFIVALAYIALNVPHTSPIITYASIDAPTVRAFQESRHIYCQPEMEGAILTDLPGLLAIESFGCRKLGVGFVENSDVALIRELAKPRSVLISGKKIDNLRRDSPILRFAASCAEQHALSDGGHLYMQCQ